MPELDRLAMTSSPYSSLDCRILEKDTSRPASATTSTGRRCYRGPVGLIVTCTALRYFTGVPFSMAGR